MSTKQHKMAAISLALLVLISTTGISMNVMLCHCSGKQYLSLIASKFNFDCCGIKAQKAVKASDCCSKKQQKKCTTPSKDGKLAFSSSDADCCSSIYKYAKANITLDFSPATELPTYDVIPSFAYLCETIQAYQTSIPKALALNKCPNKAPPRYRQASLFDWFQIYRC